jgi:hypothetical protein
VPLGFAAKFAAIRRQKHSNSSAIASHMRIFGDEVRKICGKGVRQKVLGDLTHFMMEVDPWQEL